MESVAPILEVCCLSDNSTPNMECEPSTVPSVLSLESFLATKNNPCVTGSEFDTKCDPQLKDATLVERVSSSFMPVGSSSVPPESPTQAPSIIATKSISPITQTSPTAANDAFLLIEPFASTPQHLSIQQATTPIIPNRPNKLLTLKAITGHYNIYLPSAKPLKLFSLSDGSQNQALEAAAKSTCQAFQFINTSQHDKLDLNNNKSIHEYSQDNIKLKLILDPCLVFINNSLENELNLKPNQITLNFSDSAIYKSYLLAISILSKNKSVRNSTKNNNEIHFKLPVVCRKLVRLVMQMKKEPSIKFDPYQGSQLIMPAAMTGALV